MNNIIKDCIRVLPLEFASVSSVLLVKSKLKFSPEETITLWTTAAEDVLKERITQEHADAKIGFVFLLLSIIFQIYNLSIPVRWIDLREIEKASVPILIIIFCFLLLVGYISSKKLQGRFLKRIEEKEKEMFGKE